jgi:hypothetical protein
LGWDQQGGGPEATLSEASCGWTISIAFKKAWGLDEVVHTCHPSYAGGINRRIKAYFCGLGQKYETLFKK